MLKFFPLLSGGGPGLAGADAGSGHRSGVADHRGPGSDCEDSGQDEAHHCNRAARSPRTFLISWSEIPSIGT